MKKTFLVVFSVGLLFLASCEPETISSTTSTSFEEESSVEVSTSSQDEFEDIGSLRTAEVSSEVEVKGVVLKQVYTGQKTPYITGFYLIDNTGCIYVYGEDLAKSVSVNQEISLKGTIAYYIPETDSGTAESVGYKGALQLINPKLINHISDNAKIPSSSIETKSDINSIESKALTEDITGNVYELRGKIIVSEQPGYTNYYLQSLDLMTNLPFYTQCNGKDYTWLNDYAEKYVDIYVVIMNAKPSRNEWRALPVKILSEYNPTAQDYCHYGNLRIEKTYFAKKYNEDITVAVPRNDLSIEGLSYAFKLSDQETNVTLSVDDDYNNLSFTIPSQKHEVELQIVSTYQSTSFTDSFIVELEPKTDFETESLKSIREKEDGSEVVAQGVVAQITYKSGNKKLGFVIQDETDSMVVYNSVDAMSNLDDVEKGNKVTIRGTLSHYIKTGDEDKAASFNYKGDTQIYDAEILSNDSKNNDLYETSLVKNLSVAEVAQIDPATDPVGKIYQCDAIIDKTSTAYFTSYRIDDPDDSSKSLSIYSQMQGSEYSFLDEYDGQEVSLNFAIQNIKYSSGSYAWRICAIGVVA
ncbi:MAG: hypothetical protein PHW22_04655 [Bacilli bacterium]|nr:hypothetical protein [Bacilli bacterium]